jgi:hypothetical protein
MSCCILQFRNKAEPRPSVKGEEETKESIPDSLSGQVWGRRVVSEILRDFRKVTPQGTVSSFTSTLGRCLELSLSANDLIKFTHWDLRVGPGGVARWVACRPSLPQGIPTTSSQPGVMAYSLSAQHSTGGGSRRGRKLTSVPQLQGPEGRDGAGVGCSGVPWLKSTLTSLESFRLLKACALPAQAGRVPR